MPTLREFLQPDGDGGWKWDDKAWLDDQILSYITKIPYQLVRLERNIYERFAPLAGFPFYQSRPSWDQKNRKVKRQMIAASLRRLIDAGKIRIDRTIDYKSMDGAERQRNSRDIHLFGTEHDGKVRTYTTTNALQAMADALEANDD